MILHPKSWILISSLLIVSLCSGAPINPPKNAGQIGACVAAILSKEHYLQHPIDDAVSKRFLKTYLDDLDYNHLFFLQSDIQEFQKFETTLDDETLKRNLQPGYDIYNRYVQRFEERVACIKELLKEKYTFEDHDKILLDRQEAPWPASEEEARQLWRQRIKSDILQERLNKKKPEEIIDLISKRYDRILKGIKEEDADTVLQRYLTALAKAYDPHSDYHPASELESWTISMNMQMSLVGIGAMLTTEDGFAKIISIVPGGPADLDKRLQVKDRIAGVAQGDGPMVDVVDMKLNKTVELIRGKKNTEVRLMVIPAKSPDLSNRVEIRIKRDEIKLTESQAKAKLIEKVDPKGISHKLGYIELPSFYADLKGGPNAATTTTDVARLIERLKTLGAEGIVMDLRKNGGGLLGEVVSLTGLFVDNGPVVQVKDTRGGIKVLYNEDNSNLFEGPLVILVHHTSASAAEILAAALQDYGRAVIVGEQSTFGKGTVQKVDDLDRYFQFESDKPAGAGALKITTQKFYRISGCSTQYRGVIPDIRFPSVSDFMKVNEASLKNSLPYDEVPPARFTAANQITTLLPELSKRSFERTSKDPEFGYRKEDIERLKPQLESKTVSLNEAERLAEKKMAAQRVEKRNAERLSRKLPKDSVTEITMQSLDGVPAPSVTKKVLDDARKEGLANVGEASDDDIPEEDPNIDPEREEGMNILMDIINLTTLTTKK